MRRITATILTVLLVLALSAAGLAVLWWRGLISLPFGPSYRDLAAQLRDRGTIAVVGGVPFGLPRGDTPLVSYEHFPALRAALDGRDPRAVSRAMREARLDGLLVRTDESLGAPGSVLRSLSSLRAQPTLTATFLDDTAAVYEAHDEISIDPEDARRLVAVVRVILQGAAPPADRLWPPMVRRAYPTEVAVIVRDGHEPILWRAVRGGSIGRALVDATYAIVERWSTRQQQRYGPLRDAIMRLPLTVAIFYDRGTLGERTPEFLQRAVDPRVFSIGYEQLGRWEYVLPPSPWAPIPPPVRAIATLAREHDVPPPGYLRPELTLYRFRAYQLIEERPEGEVRIFDPPESTAHQP